MARDFVEETRIGAILERLFASTPATSSLVTQEPLGGVPAPSPFDDQRFVTLAEKSSPIRTS